MMRRLRLADRRVFLVWGIHGPAAAICLVAAAGCATTGATYGSGVGDRTLSRPPYYAGAGVHAAEDAETETPARLGHVAVVYQRGAAHEAMFDPAAGPAVTRLLDALNRDLDSLGVSRRLPDIGGSPPDVRFSCLTDPGLPDECAVSGDTALGRGRQAMQLAVGRPSADWVSAAATRMQAAGVDRVLVITIEVGQYFVRQRGLSGTKEVELGTGHIIALPWMTSLETPVTVLQLTGALVGPDGRAVRIGAEGMMAHRTGLGASSIGAQALITEEDVAWLLDGRREDLGGRPRVAEVALRTLVSRLTGIQTASHSPG